jgi:hypothetical protein
MADLYARAIQRADNTITRDDVLRGAYYSALQWGIERSTISRNPRDIVFTLKTCSSLAKMV